MANGSYNLTTVSSVAPTEVEYVACFIRDALPSILTQLHSMVESGTYSVHESVYNLTCANGHAGHYISVYVASYVVTTDITWNGSIFSTQSYYTKKHNFPMERFDFDYSEDPSGEYNPGGSDFAPPEDTSPDGKTEGDFPFFDNVVSSGDVLDLDSMSQEQFDFIKDASQRGEVGLFGGLLDYQKERYMKVMADKWDGSGLDVSYDPAKSEVVNFYDTNGLDTSLNYSFDYNDLGLGYKSETVYEGIYSDFKMGLGGEIKVSSNTKSKFLDPNLGSLIVSGGSTSATGSITGGVPNVNVGVPAVISLLLSGQLDNVAETTVDYAIKGFQNVASYGSKLYSQFTNSGDRVTDIFNIGVRTEAWTKGMNSVLTGGGAMADGKVTFDTSSIDFPTIKFDEGWTFPTITFPTIPDIGLLVPDIPNIGVDLGNIPDIGVNVPTIPNIGVDAPIIPDIGINVGDKSIPVDTTGAEVKLNTEGAELPEVPNPFVGLIPLIGSYLAGEILVKNEEFGIVSTGSADGGASASKTGTGIRDIEGNVATYNVKDYESVVHQGINNTPIDKIGRKNIAWSNFHSINPDLSYSGESDTAGNNMDISKGLIGALVSSGIFEFFRESAMSKALLNVEAQAKADQLDKNAEDENDNNDDSEKENILSGVKKIVYPTEEEYISQGEGHGSDLNDLSIHSSKMAVK